MNLPLIHHGPVRYTVGLFVVGNGHRNWLVKLRLPEGGSVTVARYRTLFFAQRLVKRSWKLAR